MSFKTTCFNRYIVECKSIQRTYYCWHYICFNRYIVECKQVNARTSSIGDEVLIDTQWNVNTHYQAIIKSSNNVLIDTQWNVNQLEVGQGAISSTVLIDTQWNVNKYDIRYFSEELGF